MTTERQPYHSCRSGRRAALAAALGGVALGGAAALAWWRPFRATVDGESMEPALRAGDVVVALRRGTLRPGRVVVLRHPLRPDLEVVKRVRHGPGDPAPDGRRLGPGEYWVEGDRPERSTDSRSFGPVRRQDVLGIVVFRYGPPGV
jgi:signal peptidase I